MPPFYPNPYQNDRSQQYQQSQQYYHHPNQPNIANPHIQVVIPQRSPSQSLPQDQSRFQYQSQSPQLSNTTGQYHQNPYYQQPNYQSQPISINVSPKISSPQYYDQQAYQYNANQSQQYLPPPPQVVVPPSPQYYYQQNQQPQYPSQPNFIPVQNYQQPYTTVPQSRVLQTVQPNTNVSRQQPPPKPMEPVVEPPEPKYELLLLSLADEYMDAASSFKQRTEDYYKLVAMALGCMESVLKNFKLPPVREAQVLLRYAQILHDETNNNDDAESVLTKGIDLCERMKFLDLKYAMQMLLAKVLHKSKPKAALKDLQGMIQDVEAYRHFVWEYAFRFQYVSFAASSSSNTDIHAAIAQLERINHVSRQNGDHAIFAFAAILEAMLYLQSATTESISAAHTALAKARSLQLNPDIEKHPQISMMIEFVDFACSIQDHNLVQIEEKRKVMQTVLYKAIESKDYRKDGVMYLHVGSRSLGGVQLQDGGLVRENSGRFALAFSWLVREEAEAIGYLLSGVSAAYKNVSDGGKSERFLTEGLQLPHEFFKENMFATSSGERSLRRWQYLQVQFLLELALLQCSKGSWKRAEKAMDNVDSLVKDMEHELPQDLKTMVSYVKGCIHQGNGELDQALAEFTPIIMKLSDQQHNSPKHSEVSIRNLSILAAMNTAFIIRPEFHPRHHQLQQLINTLDPLIHDCNNKNVQASYSFLLATFSNNTILKTKQYLSNALETAKSIGNAQVTALTLTMMQEKFFKGVVGEQAVKCARAASHQVKTKWGEPMWTSVSATLEANCLAVQGSADEAERKKDEASRYMATVPPKVQQNIL